MYHSANSNGKLEAGMMVHSHIFKSIWEAAFFFPNGVGGKNYHGLFFQVTYALFQEAVTCRI